MPAGSASNSKFRLVAELGRGGMGNVYLAVVSGPAGFNKLQVIKRLRPELAEDPDSVAMFLDEARLAARLSHPNVVQTNEVGEDGSNYFIAMEYLDGQSLDQAIKRARSTPGGMPLAIHLRVLCDALAGLHHAHELTDFDGEPLGLVHRDVTPQNIFITYDGVSKLLDFGIAKAATSSHETRSGTFKGKCAYMPPEQIVGERTDRRADIFSVGAVLWQAATGERLWKGESDIRIFHRVINGEIPSPRTVNPNVPEKLEAICMRALAPRRDDRYANALEMQAALEEYCVESGLTASDRDVARFVQTLFANDRIAIKTAVDAQLRELARTSDPRQLAPVPMLGPVNDDAAAQSSKRGLLGSAPPPVGSSQSSLRAGMVVSTLPSIDVGARAHSRMRLIAGALAGVVVLGVVAFVARPSTPPAPAPAAGAVVAAAPRPTTPEADIIAVRIAASPPSARVFVDDAPLATNPAENMFLRDGAAHRVRAEAAGYRSTTRLVTFNTERANVDLVLDAVEAAPARHAAPAAAPPRAAAPVAAPAPRAPADPMALPKPTPPPRGSIDPSDPWQ